MTNDGQCEALIVMGDNADGTPQDMMLRKETVGTYWASLGVRYQYKLSAEQGIYFNLCKHKFVTTYINKEKLFTQLFQFHNTNL